MTTMIDAMVEPDAKIPTWFGVGGCADMLARPADEDQLRDTLLAYAHSPVRVLGDGANLLVDDDGIDGLVLCLDALTDCHEVLPAEDLDDHILLRVQSGVRLPKLIVECVRQGLAGIEGLAGVPASVGGAVVMNAGGRYGSMADVVHAVHAMTRYGERITIPYPQLDFGYRHSGLNHLIVTGVDLALRRIDPDEQPALRAQLKEVMAAKSASQPMGERSAGCAFKNPMVDGVRMSAGQLIDAAGCKGMSAGGATVSPVHANFIVTADGCRARDIIDLMARVHEQVLERFDVPLVPEVVVWRRRIAG